MTTMTVKRAKEILALAIRKQGDPTSDMGVTPEEVEALAQAYVDLTMANGFLELALEREG